MSQSSQSMDRRSFLERSAVAGAVLSTGLAGEARASSVQDKVVVGVMGLSRGLSLAATFGAQPNVEVKYVCDVDSDRAGSAVKSLEGKLAKPPKPITDFRQILDDSDVDALVCAAPNHWHGPATIMACQAGKHVYVEKPCSHNPAEGEMMIAAARKHKRAVQVGTQRRSGVGFHKAMQDMRDGIIGRVYMARCWYNNLRPPVGPCNPAPVPSNLNYELWQGPAPRRPYLTNQIHYNWHWFWHWGNGELGNNGVHTLDLCRWGLEVDYPIKVTSSGGRYRYEDAQQTPDTHVASFDFAERKTITWIGLSCNRHSSGFVTFYGEDGSLEIDSNGKYTVFDPRDKVIKEGSGARGDQEHVANLLAAIRNDRPLELNAEIVEGHKSTLLCHLGNIAHRTGLTLHCDPQNGHIQAAPEAEQLWSREYAPEWEPKV